MRVVLALDDRLFQIGDTFYSHHLGYESFWKSYRSVFDSVVVLARTVQEGDSVPEGWAIVNHSDVEVIALPQFHGPYQYFRQVSKISTLVRGVLHRNDAVILRAHSASSHII